MADIRSCWLSCSKALEDAEQGLRQHRWGRFVMAMEQYQQAMGKWMDLWDHLDAAERGSWLSEMRMLSLRQRRLMRKLHHEMMHCREDIAFLSRGQASLRRSLTLIS